MTDLVRYGANSMVYRRALWTRRLRLLPLTDLKAHNIRVQHSPALRTGRRRMVLMH